MLDFIVAAVRAEGTLFDFAASRPSAAPLHGRGVAWHIASPAGDCVVRHYRRGGALASVLGDRYLPVGRPRPLRELHASFEARRRGIPTPRVLAAVTYAGSPFRRGDLATELVPDAQDLAGASYGPHRASDERRVLAWAAAGALVRCAAAAGVVHADLNLKNILIRWTEPRPTAYLLDLDRCRIVPAPSARDRDRMAARIERSRLKFERLTGAAVGADALDAYRAALHG